ncbi:MAG: MFS transporter [Smithellaceae bacterium]|nr:MFS transporter [Smithellaceae bacterium]
MKQECPHNSPSKKRTIWAWAMYDWANSAFATTVMAGFFPIFFKQFWSVGTDSVVSTAKLGLANSFAGFAVALCAPLLGAIADRGTAKKRFLLTFASLGILATATLSLVGSGNWPMAATLYILAMMGFAGGNVFYDSLITSVAERDRMDMVSSLGYSLGYVGGGLLFALNVGMTISPSTFGLRDVATAVRFSFITVAIWWFLFSLPLAIYVREKSSSAEDKRGYLFRKSLRQLVETLRRVRSQKNILLFLIAYWLYIDGVDTVIVMAVDYGLSIGFAARELILALLMIQLIGVPCSLFFGFLGGKIGTRRSIFIALTVYLLIPVFSALMETRTAFFGLAAMVGLVQGGIQALSRSFFAKIIPKENSAEYFGFYNMIGKFAVIMGPLLIGAVGLLARGVGATSNVASRLSILSISTLFLLGGVFFYLASQERRV